MPTTTQSKQRRISVPLELGGMFSAGDGASMPQLRSAYKSAATPEGFVRSLSNILPLPNRFSVRPPFTYDNLMNVNGLAAFDDQTNKVSRAIAIDTSRNLYLKATSGETWSSAITGISTGSRLSDYSEYRGKLYGLLDDGSGIPSSAFSFDGTNISTTPFNSTIAARTITTFNDRQFLGYPRVTVTPLQPSVTTNAYDWSDATKWSLTNVNAALLTVGANTKVGRLSPTSTAVSGCKAQYLDGTSGMISVAASTSELPYTWRAEFRGVDPLYDVPFTLEWIMNKLRVNTTAYAVGDVIVIAASDANNYRYRATAGGTSAGAPPVFSPTLGSTTADNTVNWKNEGSEIIQALEDTVPNATKSANVSSDGFSAFAVTCTVPARTNAVFISPRLKFYNTTYPALTTLAPIDISFKDGIADGDVRKKNHGQQWTAGDYIYPFINTETATIATVDVQSIIWSEIANPPKIRGANTYEPWEAPGYITAAAAVSGRYCAFKRTAFWVFLGTDDPDIPIRREVYNLAVGCLGPRAIDTDEDEIFFLSENEVMRYRAGDPSPKPFAGDGMREEIFNKGANWVESQATYKLPLLCIDKAKLIVWIYTQKSTLYAYDLRNQRWSKHVCPNSAQVDAMTYNANTGEMYVSYGTFGVTRLDYTVTANDTIDNTANIYAVSVDIVFRPIELYEPPRFDATLEEIRFFHAATASQASQTVTAYYSYDQGTTYTKSQQVTLSPLSVGGEFLPVRLDALQTAPSVTVKLNHTGKGGAAAWTISPRVHAMLNVRRGEYIQTNQASPVATL